ncbi:PAS domain S-box-containing protein/diguanylate cyclase (GGDEF)-like protein [Caldicellulosiruptor bescii]|uniref:Diguanylate cyclase/phosphodiesterase with PAS/PAC sensor(S) n=2 Tax=Caldicellulosiruptor bescii TaxID=31899 RepID=B9MQD5_CALBD|nr:EAL domain-containing protein [Caldicellulosiruptor bescii]ACM61792.1 diguanylate cyclase/phosphodiesterase with PAS/PAC sensor(s) [Caldicellulosiruptor bescii DSM 6725]PBC88409.1 PAS domain S-box-containing protein/diguanylate cyclase (GGDEF)-like protein [Caldicellulosiruptor bescii]PBC92110.1 PAS domain S-box-containing protein/diguanylate cyclase (GGDEF)-like protein [Caldicellulosiruptor bescii]PBD05080.1 PAS domain S-box-containing protein/diguanylate cyclase (GGDEF)-like protein [Cald
MRNNKAILFVFTVLLMLFHISLANASHTPVKFEVDKNYPPFSYTSGGRIYGFTIDLANLVFEPDKFKLELSSDEWSQVYKKLVEGKIDVTAPVAIIEERKKEVHFSKPIFTRHVGLYTSKEFSKNISLKNLEDFMVGVMQSDYTETLLKEKLGVNKYYTYPTIEDLIYALVDGKIDAALMSQEIANYFLVKNNLSDRAELKIKNIFTVKSAFAVSKKRPELVAYINQRLNFLINKGIFDELYYNYFSTYSPEYFERKNRQILLSALYLLIIILFAASVIIFVMTRINRGLERGKQAYEKYAQLLAENANAIVLTLNLKGEIIYFNKFAEQITGYKSEEVVGKKWVDIFIPSHRREYIENLFKRISEVKILNDHENEIVTKNGDTRWILWNNTLIENPYLNEPLIISTGLDITQIKRTQQLLEESYEEIEQTNQELMNTLDILNKQSEMLMEEKEKYKFLVENVSDCIWEIDFNEKKIEFYGKLKDQFDIDVIKSKNDFSAWLEFFHEDDRATVFKKLQDAILLHEEKVEFESRIRDKHGNWRWISSHVQILYNEEDKPEKIIAVNIDWTAKKEYEHRIEYIAYYDALTNLPNRKLFEDRLESLIKKAEDEKTQGAVVLIDIDNFKDINDLYGHEAGDEYLIAVTKKILEYLNSIKLNTFFARVGGDEFAVILDGLAKKEEVIEVCTKLLGIFESEIYIQKIEGCIFTSASIGVSFYPDDGRSVKEIFRNVDMALSSAKENGKNDFQIFMPFMLMKNFKKIEIEKSLKKAIEADQFELYYQPVINLKDMEIHSVEALLRWVSPEKGIISPLEFIPVAEDSGLIVKIGEMVIEKAFSDLKNWEKKGISYLHMAINISARQLKTKFFEKMIQKQIERYGVNPQKISFEITETGAVENFDVSLKILSFLCQLGIKFLIDDFGTGYSSLIYLRRLPIGGVKIDRSFISEIELSKESRAIVEGIILMAHKLDLKVIAEGVETKRELEILKEIGCDFAQGYLFSKPVPKTEIEKLLIERKITV